MNDPKNCKDLQKKANLQTYASTFDAKTEALLHILERAHERMVAKRWFHLMAGSDATNLGEVQTALTKSMQ